MKHLDLRRIGPKGKRDVEWKCLDCGKIALLSEMKKDVYCGPTKKTDDQRVLDAIHGGEA